MQRGGAGTPSRHQLGGEEKRRVLSAAKGKVLSIAKGKVLSIAKGRGAMKLGEIAEKLSLSVQAASDKLDTRVTGGYASDLLSCVMAKARKGNIWVTLQSHVNIVAVASLLQLAGIIVSEGMAPDAATLQKASEEGIPILTTPHTTFTVVAQLAQLGIQGPDVGESEQTRQG